VSLVSPFIGLMFDRSVVGSHDLVTTPPYDVISPAERRRFTEASPFNVIRLELGSDGAGEPQDRYERAGELLRSWRAEGALVPTGGPAYFPYEMRFSLHGRHRTIRSLICAVELEDWGGSIVPHEHTMEGPIEDRLRLTRQVRANLSSIHALFPGPNERFASYLDAATAGEPAAVTADESGVEHRIWVAPPHPEVAAWLEPESLMIADGHHRYSMALRYRDEMRDRHGPGPWDRAMMLVADAAVQEPPVLPFHRIQVDGRLEARGVRVRDLAEVLETVSDERLVYGTAALEAGVLVHRVAELDGEPPAVVALHEQVLAGAGAGERLRYTADVAAAEEAVNTGEAVGAYFLPPTDATRIRAVIDRGERLPPKSTFFWPKPRSGLVIRPLDA
jgi:uncharacterized protein (DUF1015 family)